MAIIVGQMRIFWLRRLFSTAPSTTESLLVERLAQQASRTFTAAIFKEHFLHDAHIYEKPLFLSNGLMCYTARLAGSVSLLELEAQQKMRFFRGIKRSLMSSKLLTARSCTQITESLLSFDFEGTEQPLMQKIADFSKQNIHRFTPEEIDLFTLSFKTIIAKKAHTSIKFIPLQLQRCSRKEGLKRTLEGVSQELNKTAQVDIDKEHVEITFSRLIMKNVITKCRFKLIGLHKTQASTVCGPTIKHACRNYHAAVIAMPSPPIQPNLLSLRAVPSYQSQAVRISPIPAKKNGAIEETVRGILSRLQTNSQFSVYETKSSKMDELKTLLEERTIRQIQQVYAFAKMYSFHTELRKCLQNKPLAGLNFNYLTSFEPEEAERRRVNARILTIRSQLFRLLRDHPGIDSVLVYALEEDLPQLYRSLASTPQDIATSTTNAEAADMVEEKVMMLSSLMGIEWEEEKLNLKSKLYKGYLKPSNVELVQK